MRKRWLASMLSLSGCFNPDDIVPIRGLVEIPGQRVELVRSRFCDGQWVPLKSTNAGENGAYSFEVFRAQVQTFAGGLPPCLRVQSRFASGTVAQSTIQRLELGLELPPFFDWRPSLSIDGGALVFRPLDAGPLPSWHQATLRASDGAIAWRQSEQVFDEHGSHLEPLVFDERVLVEFDSSLSIEGRYRNREISPTAPTLTRSESVVLLPAEGLNFSASSSPASRGSTCDELSSPCALADGVLADVEIHFAGVPQVTMRFPAPITPTLIVVRELGVGGPPQFAYGDAGNAVAAFHVVQFVGFTSDGGEIEIGSRKLFANPDLDFELLPDGSVRSASHSFVVPVSESNSIVGVQLRGARFRRLTEVSVY